MLFTIAKQNILKPKKKFEKALKYKKNFWKPHYNLALCEIYDDKIDFEIEESEHIQNAIKEAIEELEKAIEISFNAAESHSLLGWAYLLKHLYLNDKKKYKSLKKAAIEQEIAINFGKSEGHISDWIYWNYGIILYAFYANKNQNNAKEYIHLAKEYIQKAINNLPKKNKIYPEDELWLKIYNYTYLYLYEDDNLNTKKTELINNLKKQAKKNQKFIPRVEKDLEVLYKLNMLPIDIRDSYKNYIRDTCKEDQKCHQKQNIIITALVDLLQQFRRKSALLNSINPLIPGGEDLEQTVAFYEQQLGFQCIHQEGDPIHMAIVKRDSAQIFLLKNGDKHLAEGTSLRINVNQIEELYAEFQAKGGEMIHPNGKLETKPWRMKEFVVLDPTGVCLTFCEPANKKPD